jgi:aspartyl-tRNA(Asn)/glutamyl-tRNA(Gln) amidotransferase subunit C
MIITDALVDHIAHLSRLEFNGKEKEAIKSDLGNIIQLMSKLSELDTSNVEPLVFMTEEFDNLREDNAVESMNHESALLNAPKKDSDYFRIPKVLDK